MLRRSPSTGKHRVYATQPNCSDQTIIFEGTLKAHFDTGKTDLILLETASYGEVLFMNGEVQSSSSDERLYHEALVRPAFVTASNKTRTLLLGGCEGCAARDMFRWGAAAITQFDYDKAAVTWSRHALAHWNEGAYRNDRLEVYYNDAYDSLKSCETLFDVIIVDLFDPLDDDIESFVKLLLDGVAHLTAGGALAAYIGDAPMPADSSSDVVQVKIIQALCDALPSAYIHPYRVWVPVFAGEACFVLIAPGGVPPTIADFKTETETDALAPVWFDEVNWLRASSWATGSPELFKELSGNYVQSCMEREASNAERDASN
jgi:spermidine synthase